VAAVGDDLAVRGRAAQRVLGRLDRARKDAALHAIADAIAARRGAIAEANAVDLAQGRQDGLSAALLDRLTLDGARIDALADAARAIAALPDPCGEADAGWRLPNALDVTRVRVPLGRVLVVYEARPNVTIDVAALCLKSGNVAILRGSRSARATNAALLEAVHAGLAASDLPTDAVIALEASRDELAAVVADPANADVVVPRGGEALKDFLLEHARIPVLAAAGGNCHVYVDATADPAMAHRIAINAKTHRPGVCNAAETLLVHADAAPAVLPDLLADLHAHGVEVRGDERTRTLAGATPVAPADEDDYATEFLDLVLAVRVVDSLDEALDHIARFATGHSEAIVTSSLEAADRFTREVDSACVYVNASTRFTDGGEYGFGAEIGNSTSRLHVRGPIGLRDLTTTKYVVRGSGQVRG
jgi:glutamate-5-semialdehyde dehydrogenase